MKRKYLLSQFEAARINILKVIMCIGVLFIHSYSSKWGGAAPITYYISKVVCDCATPAFMLISSLLLYSREFNWLENLQTKFRTLAIPYLIFNTLWIVFFAYILQRYRAEPFFVNYGVKEWLNAYLGLYGNFKPALSLLWYIRDLFILNIFSVQIKKLIDRFPMSIALLLVFYWLACGKSYFVQSYGLVFFCLGYYVVKNDLHMDLLNKIKPCYFLISFFVATGADFVFRKPQLHRFTILVVIICAIRLSEYLLVKDKMLSRIAAAVLFIYLTHTFIYHAMGLYVPVTNVKIYKFMFLERPFNALCLCTSLYYLLSCFCPTLLALMTGGRSKAVHSVAKTTAK